MIKVTAALVLTLTLLGVATAQQKNIEQRLVEALETARKGDQWSELSRKFAQSLSSGMCSQKKQAVAPQKEIA